MRFYDLHIRRRKALKTDKDKNTFQEEKGKKHDLNILTEYRFYRKSTSNI